MPNKLLVTVTKIITYYCMFYTAIKIFAVISGMWLYPNLIIGLFLAIITVLGFWIIKTNQYNWFFSSICIITLSALRYYEPTLLPYLQELLN